jgi:hypothetical protein
MTDIIDSGLWAELSHAAKTLYIVLLKFSDYNFKPVWPNTETLLRLTGFKTKKSIVTAKKELTRTGLLYHVPGGGRTATKYHFSFHYPGSKITPLGDRDIPLRGMDSETSGGSQESSSRGAEITPNHINITISNTNHNDQVPKGWEKKEDGSFESLVQTFGIEIASEALQKATLLRLETDLSYLRAVCKELVQTKRDGVLKTKHEMLKPDFYPHSSSWLGFLNWAEKELTQSTWDLLEKCKVRLDGKVLVIETPLQGYLRQIVNMYFTERVKPSVFVVFSEVEEGSRVS